FAAQWTPLHHAVWYTQIEGWYVPVFALSILALVHYRQQRSILAMIGVGITAALVFNTRLQGAFFAAALGLAPLFVGMIDWRSRIRHMAIFGVIFGTIGILPWSTRNYFIEGYFSPSTE